MMGIAAEPGKAIDPGLREPKITFRIIRRCNFDCPGCCTFSSLDRKGEIDRRDFQAAIDLLAESEFQGTLNISGGETTLHPDLPHLIGYASASLEKARIAIFTNGEWVGGKGWKTQLDSLFAGPNVLIRFSHDKEHIAGSVLSREVASFAEEFKKAGLIRMEKAALFRDGMLALGAAPGLNFDFAFKGDLRQAREFMAELGKVPVYLIRLRKDPADRPKEYGFLAVDVQEDNSLLVYLTLGHIPKKEPLGGVETLKEALEINRRAMSSKGRSNEQYQWIG